MIEGNHKRRLVDKALRELIEEQSEQNESHYEGLADERYRE